jgi:hypothetical protein
MLTIARVSKAMQETLIEKANQLAIDTGFKERDRKLTGSSFVVGLMSGWQANPQSSLAGLSQAVGNAGTPISRQGLDQRLDAKAVVFLEEMLKASMEVLVKAMPVEQSLLSRFVGVDLVDSSVITLPNDLRDIWRGSGGYGENASISALKLNVRWDVASGQLKTLDLSDGTQHDRRSAAHHQPVQAGSLVIEDLGYFKLDDLEAIGEQNAYWLSRYKLGTKLYDVDGNELDLSTWLPQQIGETVDCEAQLGKEKRLKCRLVAERVPLWVVQQRHQRIRETARQNQKEASEESLIMAQWTIYVTNVPVELLSTQEVFILGRYRWQIELLFKLWKSDLEVDKWASRKPERILCEIYTKLIGAIVTHWLLLVGCWHNPQRSLRQAMPTIRGLAWQFANSLHSKLLLRHTFLALKRALSSSRIGKSRSQPRAFQLIVEACA